MQVTETAQRGLRTATATKLVVVFGTAVVIVEGLHLYALSSTRDHARAALAQTLHAVTASDAKTVTAALDAFDRMTDDIFFAATGPFLVLAILIPSLIVTIVRLQNNLTATEDVLRSILKNGNTRTEGFIAPVASTKANHPRNGL
jgi:hypothetical protein